MRRTILNRVFLDPAMRILRLVLLMGLGLVMLGLLLGGLERSMLYHPSPLSGDHPSKWGLPCESLNITTGDGESLGAWWCPQDDPANPALLFFHGNAGTRADRLHNVQGLWRAGWSVLIFDYRGYGDSTGRPSEPGLIRDGLAAYDWLRGRVAKQPIVLFGRSLGGAVAAQTALQRSAAGLILESAFTSVPDMARLTLPLPGVGRLVRTRFDNLAAVSRIEIPLMIIHGTADELIPFTMGEALNKAAASPAKQFHAVAGGSHNDTYVVAGDAYYQWHRQFMALIKTRAASGQD